MKGRQIERGESEKVRQRGQGLVRMGDTERGEREQVQGTLWESHTEMGDRVRERARGDFSSGQLLYHRPTKCPT